VAVYETPGYSLPPQSIACAGYALIRVVDFPSGKLELFVENIAVPERLQDFALVSQDRAFLPAEL
jgi:hypothetical protein